MKHKHALLFLTLFCYTNVIFAQDEQKGRIAKHLAENPNTYRTNFLYEGCDLSLSKDDSNMLIQLFVGHPLVQMRLLSEPCTLFVDPTGKKKEKYAILLPCGNDVKQFMDSMPQPGNPIDGQNERPDLRPIISILNLYGAAWDVNGYSVRIDSDCFNLSADEESQGLVYTILIPLAQLEKESRVSEEWSFGAYASSVTVANPSRAGQGEPQRDPPMDPHRQAPGAMRGQATNNGSQMGRPPKPKQGDSQMQSFMTKELKNWISVNISDIKNANSKNTIDNKTRSCLSKHDGIETEITLYDNTIRLKVNVLNHNKIMPLVVQGSHLTLSDNNDSIFHIEFPSAADIRPENETHPDISKEQNKVGVESPRPDIRSVVRPMNEQNPTFVSPLGCELKSFEIGIDTASGTLYYDIFVTLNNHTIHSPLKASLLSIPRENHPNENEYDNARQEMPPHILDTGKDKSIIIKEEFLYDCYDKQQ